MLLEGLPSGARAGPVRLSAGNLTAALTRGYTSALDSPCDILLHDRAGLAASIRKPAVGSPYVYANAEAIAAIARGSGDVQVRRGAQAMLRGPIASTLRPAASRPRVHAPRQRPAPAALRHVVQRPAHALRVHAEPRRCPPRGSQGATLSAWMHTRAPWDPAASLPHHCFLRRPSGPPRRSAARSPRWCRQSHQRSQPCGETR